MEKKISHWHDTILNWKDNRGKDYIEWKGTPGMGDAMYGLNIAHMRAFISQKPVTLNIHWYHSEDFLYHYEDPETIVERANYIHSKYMWNSMVKLEHTFNSTDLKLYAQRYRNVNRNQKHPIARYWMFDPKYFVTPVSNKIVIWRPSFNADAPRWFKLPINDHEWLEIIEKIKNLDYQVVEIDYRTPIREAFYHIRTAQLCLTYEGMWHYIAKNFFKPHAVLSNDGITAWHTPYSVIRDPRKFSVNDKIHRLHVLIERAKNRQHKAILNFNRLVFGSENRPRSYRD